MISICRYKFVVRFKISELVSVLINGLWYRKLTVLAIRCHVIVIYGIGYSKIQCDICDAYQYWLIFKTLLCSILVGINYAFEFGLILGT